MATGCLAHPCGMEVGAFKEHILGGFRRTGIQTAEHTGMHIASSLLQIIKSRSFNLRSTPSRVTNGVPSGIVFYNHLAAFNLIRIEAVQRLAESMDDIVGNIHHII